MEIGDVAAVFAAAIAVIAALIALSSANSAKRQAEAAVAAVAEARKQTQLASEANDSAHRSMEATERAAEAAKASVDAARESNRLTQTHQDREQEERDAAAVTEASKVVLEPGGFGGLWVNIRNHARETFFKLTLENVTSDEQPTWRWQLNSNVVGKRSVYPTIEPGKFRSFPVVFTDEDGEMQRRAGHSYDIVYAYTDASGQRWRRLNSATPERIASADDVTALPLSPPTNRDFKRTVLRAILAREDGELNLDKLPDELGLDDKTVQRCLHELHEEGCIDVNQGDDRILSVLGVAAAGRRLVETDERLG